VAALTEAELLATWEDGLDKTPTVRASQLAAAASGADPTDIARLPLGSRDRLLFDLRESCFGTDLCCEVDCPACAQRLEIEITTTQLCQEPAATATSDVVTPEGTVVVRPVTGADLVDLDETDRRRAVIRRCVLDTTTELSDAVVEAVAARLPDLDPQADLGISLSCEGCGHEWEDRFDIASFVWTELDTYARRLMYEVHVLALAYGWSEAESLAVSPHRRRLYIEAVPT
jgi:hypothetical protein